MPVNFLSATPSNKFNSTPSAPFHTRAHSQPPTPLSHTPPSRSISSSPASQGQPRARSRNRLRKHRKTASLDTGDDKPYHLDSFSRLRNRVRTQHKKDDREFYSSQSRGTLGGFWTPRSDGMENINGSESAEVVKPGFSVEVGLGIDDVLHQEVEETRDSSMLQEIEIVLDADIETENYTWTSLDNHTDENMKRDWMIANGQHEDANPGLLELPAEVYSPRSSSIYSEDRTLVAELDATIQALRYPSPARMYASPEQLAGEYQALIVPPPDSRLPTSSLSPSPRFGSAAAYKSPSTASPKPRYQTRALVTPANPLGISTSSIPTPPTPKVKSDIPNSNSSAPPVPVSITIIPQIQSSQPKPLRKIRPHASLRTLASSSSASSLRSPVSTRSPEDSPPPIPSLPVPKAKSTSPRHSTFPRHSSSNFSTISSCTTLVDVPHIPAHFHPQPDSPPVAAAPNTASSNMARPVEMVELRAPSRTGSGPRWGEMYQSASANMSTDAVDHSGNNGERDSHDASTATLPILHAVAYTPPPPPTPKPTIPTKSTRRRSYTTGNLNLGHNNHSTPNLHSHNHSHSHSSPSAPHPPPTPRIAQAPFSSSNSRSTTGTHSRTRSSQFPGSSMASQNPNNTAQILSQFPASVSAPAPAPNPDQAAPSPNPDPEEPKWVEIPTSESLQLCLTLLTSKLSTSLLRKSKSRLQKQQASVGSPAGTNASTTASAQEEESTTFSSSSDSDSPTLNRNPNPTMKPKRIGLPEIHILLTEYSAMREAVRQEVKMLRDLLASTSTSQEGEEDGRRGRSVKKERDIKAEIQALEKKDTVLSTWVNALKGLVVEVEGYRRVSVVMG